MCEKPLEIRQILQPPYTDEPRAGVDEDAERLQAAFCWIVCRTRREEKSISSSRNSAIRIELKALSSSQPLLRCLVNHVVSYGSYEKSLMRTDVVQ